MPTQGLHQDVLGDTPARRHHRRVAYILPVGWLVSVYACLFMLLVWRSDVGSRCIQQPGPALLSDAHPK